MTDDTITFLLLRKKLEGLLQGIHYTLLPDAFVRENGEEMPPIRFAELLKEALRYQVNGRDYYLHGHPTGRPVPPILRFAHSFEVSYLDVHSYITELIQAYSWCLIPWGVYGTGQMIAFLSDDQAVSRKVKKYLMESNRELLVSSYTVEQLRAKRFRGAIFRGEDGTRSEGLWTYGGVGSALVLTYDSDRPTPVPDGAEVVCEGLGYQLQPVLRRWIRVKDKNALTFYLNRNTAIVTAPDLEERTMWLALQDFAQIASRVNEDRLSFGLKALETASWIYIPRHDDQGWEIYINHDPTVTTRVLEAESLARIPNFSHKFFC